MAKPCTINLLQNSKPFMIPNRLLRPVMSREKLQKYLKAIAFGTGPRFQLVKEDDAGHSLDIARVHETRCHVAKLHLWVAPKLSGERVIVRSKQEAAVQLAAEKLQHSLCNRIPGHKEHVRIVRCIIT